LESDIERTVPVGKVVDFVMLKEALHELGMW